MEVKYTKTTYWPPRTKDIWIDTYTTTKLKTSENEIYIFELLMATTYVQMDGHDTPLQ